MPATLIARISRAARGERGSSLVAVIGIAAVLSLFLVMLVSSVVFAIGQATSSRASISAKASAEAGIEAAASGVTGGVCWVGGSGSSADPQWQAQVQKLVSAGADPALEASWTNGCPTVPAPPATTMFRVISTGWTGAQGTGNDSGDVRTMVAQFSVKQRPPSPEFNQAIFGKVNTSAATNLTITGTDADILTDHMTCSTAMNSTGGIYINSSLSETSTMNTTCEIQGDLVTKGNLQCPADGKVHGDVVAAGNVKWNTTCRTWGDMWVGGDLDCPSGGTIDGNLTVVGNFSMTLGCNVGGDIHVGGTMSITNTKSFAGHIWAKKLSGNAGLTLTSGSTIRVGGAGVVVPLVGMTAGQLVGTSVTVPDASLPAPAAPNMEVWFPSGDPMLNFPKISVTDARWSGWTMRRWKNDLEAVRGGSYSWVNVCSITGSGFFTAPLTITTPTIYDLTSAPASGGCGTGSAVGLGGTVTLKLYADVVMFVPGAEFRTPFRIESGDGGRHSAYVIESWPAAMTSCSTPTAGIRGINLAAYGSSVISQGPNTTLMVYTPGVLRANGPATVTGQLYGCDVNLSNPVVLNFQAANSGGGLTGRSFIVTERFRMDNQALSLAP
jgi:cytoskeletal protein CcmA (bactofilin family)